MKILIMTLAVLTLSAAASDTTLAGQARVIPVSDLVNQSSLIAVVQVTKVTQVDVPTGPGQISSVYVAEAEVTETIKSDINPAREKRIIAIVGSTIPRSTAVWQPIEKKTYLAFLNREQGHYRYGIKYAFREIGPDDHVTWYDYDVSNASSIQFEEIDVKEAIDRIRKFIK